MNEVILLGGVIALLGVIAGLIAAIFLSYFCNSDSIQDGMSTINVIIHADDYFKPRYAGIFRACALASYALVLVAFCLLIIGYQT